MSESSFLCLTVTPNELSIVAETKYEDYLSPYLMHNKSEERKKSWNAIRVSGQVKMY